jgi:drug/metabolite transporter (DMT)-like permease
VAFLSRPLLGERVGAHVSLAVLFAFAGVIAVVRPSFEIAAPVAAVATAGAFFYALADALAMIWLRKIGPARATRRWCSTSRWWAWPRC